MRFFPALLACMMSASLVGCVIPTDDVYVVEKGHGHVHHAPPPKPPVYHKPYKPHPKPAVHKPVPSKPKPPAVKPHHPKPKTQAAHRPASGKSSKPSHARPGHPDDKRHKRSDGQR